MVARKYTPLHDAAVTGSGLFFLFCGALGSQLCFVSLVVCVLWREAWVVFCLARSHWGLGVVVSGRRCRSGRGGAHRIGAQGFRWMQFVVMFRGGQFVLLLTQLLTDTDTVEHGP